MLLILGCALFCGGIVHHPYKQRVFNKETSSDDGGSDDEESPDISKYESVIWLSILTLVISVLSEYLVNTIEVSSYLQSKTSLYVLVCYLLFIINIIFQLFFSKMVTIIPCVQDISLGVVIGSSTQISMFSITFCVVVGWILGRPLDLNFQPFETATLLMTVRLVALMLKDGTSNYFKGLILVFSHLIVAASFFLYVWILDLCKTNPGEGGFEFEEQAESWFGMIDLLSRLSCSYYNYGCRHIQFPVLIRREVE
ncbi:putative calcium/proton exchanger [Helianthus debilis subsp. tardiflorus]